MPRRGQRTRSVVRGFLWPIATIFYALALQGLAALPAIKGASPYILVTQPHGWHPLRDKRKDHRRQLEWFLNAVLAAAAAPLNDFPLTAG